MNIATTGIGIKRDRPVASTQRAGRRGDGSGVVLHLPSRAATRLLAALGQEGGVAEPDPDDPDRLVARSRRGAVTLARGHHAASAADELVRHDLAERMRSGIVHISPAGRAHLARRDAEAEDERFAAQHRRTIDVDIAGRDGPVRARINAAESPLDWLARRRDATGAPLIEPIDREAGERLRADLTKAGLLPSVTARWDGAVGTAGVGARDPAGAADSVIAARQRVRAALSAVGGDFADLLVDLCGFLKGLEAIELERRWPARSAKVVVRLALRRLAEHYGYEREARGPAGPGRIRAWAARPDREEAE